MGAALSRSVSQVEVRCHRCSYFIGETDVSLEFVGMVKRAKDRMIVEPPRRSWLCPKCRWCNIFKPLAA